MGDSLINQGKESLLIPDQTHVILLKVLNDYYTYTYKMFSNQFNVCMNMCMSNTVSYA